MISVIITPAAHRNAEYGQNDHVQLVTLGLTVPCLAARVFDPLSRSISFSLLLSLLCRTTWLWTKCKQCLHTCPRTLQTATVLASRLSDSDPVLPWMTRTAWILQVIRFSGFLIV